MTQTVDYLPLANGSGANAESQAQYVTDLGSGGSLENGYQSGIASSAQVNKTLRQSSMMSAAIANFISATLSIDVLDNGDLAALIVLLEKALVAGAAPSCFQTTMGNTQAITGSANPVPIILNTKVFDDLNEYNTANGRFTAQKSGTYCFTGAVTGDASQTTVGLRAIGFAVNGVTPVRIRVAKNFEVTGPDLISGSSGPMRLTAGDYVQMYYFSQYSETIPVPPDNASTYFGGWRIK